MAKAADTFLEELLNGTASDEATEPTPITVAPEAPMEPGAARIRKLGDALREAGYAEPELDTVISDPVRDEVIAEAEAFWPEGLQRGLGKPVVLELDPEQADLPRLQELGYEVFTSVDSLWGYVERSGREPFGGSSTEIPVATSWLDEGWTEEDSAPETTDFGKEILGLYERSKNEAGYTPSALLNMVSGLGPLGTARKLLAAPAVSDGFANLWDKGRLDLTVEALVLQPRFAPLFTEEELGRARTRLEQFGHPFLDD